MQHTPLAEFHHPQGFLSLAKNVGIKDTTLDLTVIYSTVRARTAAMFTRSRFPGRTGDRRTKTCRQRLCASSGDQQQERERGHGKAGYR